MAKLYVMLGLPGSGKSYQARILAAKEEAKIYSSDSFRLELDMDPKIDKENNDLFDLMYARIREELDEGKDIILDATNTYAKYRRKLFKVMEGCEASLICIIVMRQYDNCLKANRQRPERIDDEVILRMYREFDLPYYDEPWDRIEVIYTDDDEKALGHFLDFKDTCRSFMQYSPYHQETLYEHLKTTYELLSEEKEVIRVAGAIHDCGKPFCQSFYNRKGEISPYAHYIGHEHVGSYMSMFMDLDNDDPDFRLHVAFLIGQHMRPMIWKESPKAFKRDQERFSSELMEELEILYEADKNSRVIPD